MNILAYISIVFFVLFLLPFVSDASADFLFSLGKLSPHKPVVMLVEISLFFFGLIFGVIGLYLKKKTGSVSFKYYLPFILALASIIAVIYMLMNFAGYAN